MQERTSTTSDERVTIEIADGVAEVTLNRPGQAQRARSRDVRGDHRRGESLSRTRACAPSCSPARKGFCAGLDKARFDSRPAGARDKARRSHEAHAGIANAFQQAAYVWRTLPVPVIAAIHGVALGGGFQIALGADIRYVAPDARLAIMEIKWGIVPDMGGLRSCANSPVPT